MIQEATIDKIIESMESEDFKDQFVEEQPQYWHYLNSDSFKGLSEEAHQLAFFVNSVIFHAITSEGHELETVDIELYQELEEINWGLREKIKAWDEAKDAYFENYIEEDLLAFVEDMLVDAEETISDISKEIIFITAKSYIDYFVKITTEN